MTELHASHWVDDPISGATFDLFGRLGYAQKAAQLIAASHTWDSSVVFGLTGSWGSGKSSVVSMLSQHLVALDQNWVIAEFTPWATGDLNGLLAEFYGALGNALPSTRRRDFLTSAGSLLRIAAPAAKLIPIAGDVVEDITANVSAALTQQKPWSEQFKNAAHALRETGKRVLVVADDIDRLQADELLSLLKVVRLLGRFPGVQYLLAYDEQTVFRTIKSSSLGGEDARAAEKFMEKIIQYPLTVPPLLRQQQMKQIEHGLDQIFTDRSSMSAHDHPELMRILLSQLDTPRSIGRFLAQLRHHVPMLAPREVNDADLIGITLMRTAFPSLFAGLPKWRDALITGHTHEVVAQDGPTKYRPLDLTPLLRDVDPTDRDDARDLLLAMFPKLDASPSASWEGPSPQRGISDAAYFNRYLAMGIPDDDISNVRMAELLEQALSGSPESLDALIVNEQSEASFLGLDKLVEVAVETRADPMAVALVICNFVPRLSAQGTESWFPPRTHACELIAELLLNEPDIDAVAILSAFESMTFRDAHRIWRRLTRIHDSLWKQELSQGLSLRASTEFISSVSLRDEAPLDDDAVRCMYFALAHDKKALLSNIAHALTAKAFTAEDLAARFVHSILEDPYTEEPRLRLDMKTWVPIAAELGLVFPPSELEKEPVPGDSGWSDRRRVARLEARHDDRPEAI